MGVKRTFVFSKKILKQTDKQRVFILVSCVDCSRGDAGFFGDLVQRGFLKTVSKKLRIGSLNDPVIQGMIPAGHVFTPLHLNNNIVIDNDIIITSFLLLVDVNCTLFRKNTPWQGPCVGSLRSNYFNRFDLNIGFLQFNFTLRWTFDTLTRNISQNYWHYLEVRVSYMQK